VKRANLFALAVGLPSPSSSWCLPLFPHSQLAAAFVSAKTSASIHFHSTHFRLTIDHIFNIVAGGWRSECRSQFLRAQQVESRNVPKAPAMLEKQIGISR
jgi:hypothetical protein